MTVAELIAELQKLPPALAVRVVMSSVYVVDELGESDICPTDAEALEADQVQHMGSHVLIRSR